MRDVASTDITQVDQDQTMARLTALVRGKGQGWPPPPGPALQSKLKSVFELVIQSFELAREQTFADQLGLAGRRIVIDALIVRRASASVTSHSSIVESSSSTAPFDAGINDLSQIRDAVHVLASGVLRGQGRRALVPCRPAIVVFVCFGKADHVCD